MLELTGGDGRTARLECSGLAPSWKLHSTSEPGKSAAPAATRHAGGDFTADDRLAPSLPKTQSAVAALHLCAGRSAGGCGRRTPATPAMTTETSHPCQAPNDLSTVCYRFEEPGQRHDRRLQQRQGGDRRRPSGPFAKADRLELARNDVGGAGRTPWEKAVLRILTNDQRASPPSGDIQALENALTADMARPRATKISLAMGWLESPDLPPSRFQPRCSAIRYRQTGQAAFAKNPLKDA